MEGSEEEALEGELVQHKGEKLTPADKRTAQLDKMREKLLNALPRAVEIITELAEFAENERVRLAAAQDIADRAGLGKTQHTQISVSQAEHEIAQREAEEMIAKLDKQREAQSQHALPKPSLETLIVLEGESDDLPVALPVPGAVEAESYE